ncbi:maltokinase N-terminal cap-like domain-containing protein [Nocardioides ultimimeridianus]
MAKVHTTASISPTKPEVLEAHLGGPVEILGSYRFDDPEGEVGVEGFVVRRDGATRHVVLTYRAALLVGADDFLVATMQHSELGARWVYDGLGDPVALGCFRRALLGEQAQATLEVYADGVLVGTREPTVRLALTRTPGATTDQPLTIADDLDVPLPAAGARLDASWDGGQATVATLG